MIGLQRLDILSCPPAKYPPAKCQPYSLVTPSGDCVNQQSFVTLTLYTKQQTLFSMAPADLPEFIVVFIYIVYQIGVLRYNKTNMPCQCGYPDGMSPLGRMVFPWALPSEKPSSLWETFHQDTHTGMAYLYNNISMSKYFVQQLALI